MGVRVAVDAMGGDRAPQAPVYGVLAAIDRAHDLDVVLVGPARLLDPLVPERYRARVSIVDAPDLVGEEPKPALRVRQRANASVVQAVRLVAQDRADVAVSVGNTGAVLAAAVIELGLLPGVRRPVVAGRLRLAPRTLFADLGASADIGPRHFVDFAHLTVAWHRAEFGGADPSVGLLANGREPSKGTRTTRAAAELLRLEAVNFQGFVEPADLLAGRFDVVLVDGYAGNLVLKTIEGLSSWFAERVWAVAAPGPNPELSALLGQAQELSDITRSDQAITVLGVKGTVVPGHGRASPADITRLVLGAREAVQHDAAGRFRNAWMNHAQSGAETPRNEGGSPPPCRTKRRSS